MSARTTIKLRGRGSLVLFRSRKQPFAIERDLGMLTVRFGWGVLVWWGAAR